MKKNLIGVNFYNDLHFDVSQWRFKLKVKEKISLRIGKYPEQSLYTQYCVIVLYPYQFVDGYVHAEECGGAREAVIPRQLFPAC